MGAEHQLIDGKDNSDPPSRGNFGLGDAAPMPLLGSCVNIRV